MKKILILAIVLLITLHSNSQERFKALDQWLTSNVDDLGGRAILVVYKEGKLVYNHAVNDTKPRQKIMLRLVAKQQGKEADFSEYTLTSRQPIASCSKWLSAALILTFVDEGKLKLSDTVGKFLPILSKDGKGKITISDCLSHLTGLKSPDLREDLKEMRSYNTMEDAIAQIASYPVEGPPGKVFRYSNTGLQIAGAVIEKIGGKSFETLFADRIANPLKMKDTDFGKGKVPLPAGGASSTPNDYLNFLVMILNKGTFNGTRILSENSIAQMQVNRITSDVKVAYSPSETKGLGYGYGEWVAGDGNVSSPGLFGSYPWVNTTEKYAAFLMVFNLKAEGRQAQYTGLKKLVDSALK